MSQVHKKETEEEREVKTVESPSKPAKTIDNTYKVPTNDNIEAGDIVRFSNIEVNIEIKPEYFESQHEVEHVHTDKNTGYTTIKCKDIDRYYASSRFFLVEKHKRETYYI